MSLRSIVVVILVGALLALAFTFFGGLHPAADSLAVVRPAICAGVLVSAVASAASGARTAGVVGVGVAVLGIASTWPAPAPHEAAPSQRVLYQKNLLFRLHDPEPLLADIDAVDPDVITLQEVTARLVPVLGQLDVVTRHRCSFAVVGGVVVASRWPAVPGSAGCAEGFAYVQLDTPDGPVWVGSVHLHWPWPYQQADQVEQILPVFADRPGPWLIGGDFNAVPWSSTIGRLTRASGTRVASGHLRSFDVAQLYPLSIDHVLVPEGASSGAAALRPMLGSDHHGVELHWGLTSTAN